MEMQSWQSWKCISSRPFCIIALLDVRGGDAEGCMSQGCIEKGGRVEGRVPDGGFQSWFTGLESARAGKSMDLRRWPGIPCMPAGVRAGDGLVANPQPQSSPSRKSGFASIPAAGFVNINSSQQIGYCLNALAISAEACLEALPGSIRAVLAELGARSGISRKNSRKTLEKESRNRKYTCGTPSLGAP